LISFTGIVYPSPVHHTNLYPSLSAKAQIVNVSVSIVYVWSAFVVHSNEIVYSIGVQLALTVLFPVSVAKIPLGVHPLNVYPSLVRAVNVIASPKL
jgi:hypothetical protein